MLFDSLKIEMFFVSKGTIDSIHCTFNEILRHVFIDFIIRWIDWKDSI